MVSLSSWPYPPELEEKCRDALWMTLPGLEDEYKTEQVYSLLALS
jgi:hypothetical protein